MENNEILLPTERDEALGTLRDESDLDRLSEDLGQGGAVAAENLISDDSNGDRDEYKRLVKTKFKDYFTEDVEKIINRRFKKYKIELERLHDGEANEPIGRGEVLALVMEHMDALKQRYGEASLDKIESDERFLTLAAIGAQSGGFGVEDAYMLAHFDSIVEKEREHARRDTEEALRQSIMTRRARPDENALSSASVKGRLDVSGLSKKERAEIAKRAANGEKIYF